MDFLDYTGLSHFLDKLKTIFPLLSSKGTANGVASLDASSKVPVSQLPVMVGATSSSAGGSGVVPPSSAGDQNKYLKADGTWSRINVPATSVTATASGWSNSTQTLTVQGVTAASTILVGPGDCTDAQYEAICNASIRCIAQGTDSITLKCSDTPSIDLPISVCIL